MGNLFTDAMEKEVAWKLTENGLDALNTTFDNCLNLFSTIGALRTRSDSDITNTFAKAYREEPLTAIKILFYARDIEEGLGERRAFRLGLKWLALNEPEVTKLNVGNIVKYGRWDDLYELVGTPVEDEAFNYMKRQLTFDIDAMQLKPINGKYASISLMAKWLKSVNTSSKESNALGKLTAKHFEMTEKNYRKMLSKLRSYIKVLETTMSNNEWDKIDFNTVSGGAMKKYVGAFYKHQEERYKEYLEALKSGKKIVVDGVEKEAKINTKNLYPYEIIEKYIPHGLPGPGNYWESKRVGTKPELEAMWNGLKDWINGVECNTIVVADTSGSMNGRPMAASVGLGIYFAERNTGPFHNKFMTFASKPSWIQLQDGSTLAEKINAVPGICDNTNLEATFDLILKVAVENKLSQDDMPKSLVIITDMEFDYCVGSYWNSNGSKLTFYDKMVIKYSNFGYKLPEIVFWNVNARQDTFHATKSDVNVRIVSGQATSIFKSLIDGKTHSPYELMLEVVYKDRYDSVVLK